MYTLTTNVGSCSLKAANNNNNSSTKDNIYGVVIITVIVRVQSFQSKPTHFGSESTCRIL